MVEYGFHFTSALDNEPLRFEEFGLFPRQYLYLPPHRIDYELEGVHSEYVEQIIKSYQRLLDPIIEVRPIEDQIDDIISEIQLRIERNERVLITTLTKRMAEDLTDYLKEFGLKVAYLHSETRDIRTYRNFKDLRLGKYDVLIGINIKKFRLFQKSLLYVF